MLGSRGYLKVYGASLVAQLAKNPHAIQDIRVRFLGQENPLEKRMVYPL